MHRLLSRRHLAVIAVLAVLAWGLRARARSGEDLGPVERVALRAVAPVQKAVWTAASAVRGLFSGYLALVGTERENRELRARVARLQEEVARTREIELENARLRELAGLRRRVRPTPIGARVIARGASERYRTVRIDRGGEDGLVQGMPVIAPGGVVGQVVRVGARAADVMLVTDPQSAVAVAVQETRVRGVVEGLGASGCALRYVARTDLPLVSEGALLVTSGEDGLFPAGLPVGRVGAVDAGPTGLFLDARVEPAVDLDRLEELLVLVPGAEVEAAEPLADPAAIAGPVAGIPEPPEAEVPEGEAAGEEPPSEAPGAGPAPARAAAARRAAEGAGTAR